MEHLLKNGLELQVWQEVEVCGCGGATAVVVACVVTNVEVGRSRRDVTNTVVVDVGRLRGGATKVEFGNGTKVEDWLGTHGAGAARAVLRTRMVVRMKVLDFMMLVSTVD